MLIPLYEKGDQLVGLSCEDNQSFTPLVFGENDAPHLWRDLLARCEYERCCFPHLYASDSWEHQLDADFYIRKHPEINHGIDCQQTWNEYLASRSRKFKKSLNLSQNRINKSGNWAVKSFCLSELDANQATALINVCVDISRRSWKGANENALHIKSTQQWVNALVTYSALNSHAKLHLWVGYLDDTAVCYELHWVDTLNKQTFGLRSDYDQAHDGLGVGTVLQATLLQASMLDELCKSYWLGFGDNPYKAKWSDMSRQHTHLTLTRKSIYTTMEHVWLSRTKPWFKKLMKR